MFTWGKEVLTNESVSEVPIAYEIGEERAGFTGTGVESQWWRIFFRKANILVLVGVEGSTGTFSLDNAIAHARIIEGRM